MGLDNRAYLRGMDEVERVTDTTTRRMAQRFRTSVDDQNRRERDQAKRRREFQRDFAKGWQVATVAAAASIAFMATSLDAAAERNPVVAKGLSDVASAAKDLRADIGEDLFGLGGSGVDDAIRGLGRLRSAIVDTLASANPNESIYAVNDALDAQREVARAIDRAKTYNQLVLELKSSLGSDTESADQLALRAIRERISGFADGQQLSTEQRQQLRDLAESLHTRRIEQRGQRAADTTRDELDRLRIEREKLMAGISERYDPYDTSGRQRVIELEHELRLRQQIRSINQNELLTAEQKRQLVADTTTTLARQRDEQLHLLRLETERAKRQAELRFKDQLRSDRITLLRLGNQRGLADAEQVQLDFDQRERDISADDSLTYEQKRQLLVSSARLARARLLESRREDGGSLIEAGFAGGATLRRQVLGAGGNGAEASSPLVAGVNSIIDKMDRIIEINSKATTAVAAP